MAELLCEELTLVVNCLRSVAVTLTIEFLHSIVELCERSFEERRVSVFILPGVPYIVRVGSMMLNSSIVKDNDSESTVNVIVVASRHVISLRDFITI